MIFLRKACGYGNDRYIALFQYRNTPGLDCLEESPLYSMIFDNILTIFEPNLNLRKSGILTLFQKFMISQSISILAIVSHPHYLPGFNHLSSIALQNKTIIGQHSTIEICFSRFAIVAFIFTGLCCGWL